MCRVYVCVSIFRRWCIFSCYVKSIKNSKKGEKRLNIFIPRVNEMEKKQKQPYMQPIAQLLTPVVAVVAIENVQK